MSGPYTRYRNKYYVRNHLQSPALSTRVLYTFVLFFRSKRVVGDVLHRGFYFRSDSPIASNTRPGTRRASVNVGIYLFGE